MKNNITENIVEHIVQESYESAPDQVIEKNTEESESKDAFPSLTDHLSNLYSGYKAALELKHDRSKTDWDLCSSGTFSEAELISAYSKSSGIPIIEEDDIHNIDRYENISVDFLINWSCIPYIWTDDSVELLISDPYSVSRFKYIFKSLYDIEPSFYLSRRTVIDRLIQSTYYSENEIAPEDDFLLGNEEDLRSLASEAKIVRLVNEIFSRAVEMNASDIHIEPEESMLAVRFRIDGILHNIMSPPISQYPAIVSRIKLLGDLNIAETRLPQDGRTNLNLGRNEIDLRISTIPIMNGESMVLRILRKDTMDFNLKGLGMESNVRSVFDRLITLPHGILLVVGPTGSGKTTTLYSVMNELNSTEKKIITIEDPVEYRLERLNQMQVNPQIGLDFASGLRHIVRQDPDIILVGEIRDKETADIAIHAALTGHLVLSTLHTNDAAGAVSRLLDMGVEGFLISSALSGVLSQRLVRTLCISCNGSGEVSKGSKCSKCNGTGFKGRSAIFELLDVNDEIRSAIANNSDSKTIADIAKRNGMVPLIEDGKKKVKAGLTTEAELARAVADV